MSRSGYVDDMDDQWAHIRWRGAVASAFRGKRGQAFLREMLAALDAMPKKRLVASALEADGQVCAIGSVGRARGIDMKNIDPEDYSTVAGVFGIAEPMAQEIVYMNDECFSGPAHTYNRETNKYDRIENTPERRFEQMRAWVASKIKPEVAS